MRMVFQALCVGVVMGMLAVAGCDLAPYRESKAITAPASEAARPLAVETRNGGVTVTRANVPEVKIEAVVRAQSPERARDAKIKSEVNGAGELLVSVEFTEGARQGEGASFEITTPQVRSVRIETGNGPIWLKGTSGEARLATSNGRITVDDHDGPVRARTSNGEIHLDFVEGEIDARTSNGRVTVNDAAGPVRVQTSNGRVRVALTADNPGPVDASSSNGSMVLLVGPAFAGTLKLETSNGSMTVGTLIEEFIKSSKVGRRSATIEFKGAGADSKFSSSNGSIEVNRAPENTRGNSPQTPAGEPRQMKPTEPRSPSGNPV